MGLKEHQRHSKTVTSTRRWQTVRHAVLERDGWKCVECGGRLEVDHIKPVRSNPELSFDPGNCQALCGPCHTRKTRIEIGHKPMSKPRQDWRKSVSELEAKSNEQNGETNA
jgi:5-methylcytosine-specific restriction endonuclease McrA